ncbi:MAG: sulfite exporter TauE/SafE family protein [Chlorobium phaeobacteroides]|uniref:Urease accessory protein UreH-like transmembrane domain-containing protein n=1 Tax=Chlorobium phaeobacteroides (strain BS1) TaxID=331678 RepID=B3EK69_CHLPB|nr:sulfite exporter TauE/SafE family protein [Chlorobium phaeobacteroides]MBL6956714.1 sulfite exporter TauE/SafE family protein [Chlorobium phaeobacteroides]NEX13985.1 sulfite exporter TauE/SafE family protein [Prosthecochloris sp.]
MESVLIVMLLTGLAGGFGHCIGMCGPVVAAYSLGEQKLRYLHHILYNLGRITTYMFMGAVVGLTGSFLVLTASIEKIQAIIMVVAGISIIIMGIAIGGWVPLRKTTGNSTWLSSIIQKTMELFKGPRTVGTYYPMGIVLGFLPCGLTYTALLAAARASMEAENHLAGMLQGAVIMIFFGLGTAPALLLVGRVINFIGEKAREKLYKLASLIMILTGVYFVVKVL